MKQGICHLSLVPMRAEPSDKSEQTNQLLYGDSFEIIEEKEKWVQIELDYDNYVGWIDKLQFKVLDQKIDFKDQYVITPAFSDLTNNADIGMNLFAGSFISKKIDLGLANMLNSMIQNIAEEQIPGLRDRITKHAKQFLGTPYQWGGKSVAGIDCSGFTQLVFRCNGMRILRDASQQAGQGSIVNFLMEAQAGDLAFFDNEEGQIIHVGILLDNRTIIHASGQVRIDQIDHQGIYNKELQKYTHQLRFVRSMFQ